MNYNTSKSQTTNIKQNTNQKSPDECISNQIPHRESSSKVMDQVNSHKNNYQDKSKIQSQPHNFLEQNEINEKFFPPKTNYFISENNDKIKNCLQSPIIDYFSHTSNNYLQKFHSPEEIIDANKNSNSNNNINNKNNE